MHWNTFDNQSFVLREDSILKDQLPPDIYKIEIRRGEVFFIRVSDNSDNLLRLSSSVITEAVKEIDEFWGKKEFFRKHGFPFCRGLLLYGPQGSGKSCAARMIINDVVSRGGIAIIVDHIFNFSTGMQVFRQQQPDTPVVAIIEDIERLTVEYDYENELLQVLDGIGGFDGVVYLATTNFIEKLAARIKNRPSRFDRKFYVGLPSEENRLEYLQFLAEKGELENYPIETWAKETEGLSFAHLKELFVSVACFDLDYKESIERLKHMGMDREDEEEDEDEPLSLSEPEIDPPTDLKATNNAIKMLKKAFK